MLPAGCHHNPNCLPISFLRKLIFEAVYGIAHAKYQGAVYSIPSSTIAGRVHCRGGLSTRVNRRQSVYASTMKEHQGITEEVQEGDWQ